MGETRAAATATETRDQRPRKAEARDSQIPISQEHVYAAGRWFGIPGFLPPWCRYSPRTEAVNKIFSRFNNDRMPA